MKIILVMEELENLILLGNVISMIGQSGLLMFKMVFDVVIKVMLIIIMFGMGSVIELDFFLKYIK